jgi:hypothetical protein
MSVPTANVAQYIKRNFPDLFPETMGRFEAYISSLLGSEDVVAMLDIIASYTDPGMESGLMSPGGDSSFFFNQELHPLAQKYQDLRYQTVITYSRYFKDMTLFQMINDWFLDGAAQVSFSSIASWPVVKTMDESHNKAFDQGYHMDMFVQSLSVLMFRMFYTSDYRIPGNSFQTLVASIDKIWDLLVLVTPARIPVIFNTIPMYYVGGLKEAPYEFLSDIVSGNLYVDGKDVFSNPNRPFYLENQGNEVHLAYEGSFEIRREGDEVVFEYDSGGMTVVASPFEDPVQSGVAAGLDENFLGIKEGYYFEVTSNVPGQFYDISREGRRLKILLDCMSPITDVTVRSNHSLLDDVVLSFDPDSILRHVQGSFPLYSVQIILDFD